MAQPGPQDIQYKPLKKIQTPKAPPPATGQPQPPKRPQAGQSQPPKVPQPGQSQPPKVPQPGQSKPPKVPTPNHTENQQLSDKTNSEFTRERIYFSWYMEICF